MRQRTNKDYSYVVEPLPKEDGCGYVAYHPELGRQNVFAFGDTPESAIARLDTSRAIWLECSGNGRNDVARPFTR
jgi:hypothetical protein